jgi:hypothetical protein
MKARALPATLGILFAACLHASPAEAILQTFVSGGGNDMNPCTRAAPCRSFQAAHNAANAGGFINCLDVFDSNTGDTFIITKSITIDCTGIFAKVIGPSMGSAVAVNGAGIVVTLRGLSIESGGSVIGIDVQNAATVRVEHCKIFGFQFGIGKGVRFAPPTGVTTKLNMSDSVINDNGLSDLVGGGGGGIFIQPAGSGSARVVLNRVQVENNFQGILVDGTFSTGVILVDVRDSVVASNRGHGIAAISSAGASPTGIIVDRTSSAFNLASGSLAQGAAVHLGNSTVTGNNTGLNAAGGGQILSYQNNQTSGNFTDGAPTGVLTLR